MFQLKYSHLHFLDSMQGWWEVFLSFINLEVLDLSNAILTCLNPPSYLDLSQWKSLVNIKMHYAVHEEVLPLSFFIFFTNLLTIDLLIENSNCLDLFSSISPTHSQPSLFLFTGFPRTCSHS